MSAGPEIGQQSAPAQAPFESTTGSFSRSEATYAALAGLFVVTLVLTNVIASKLFEVPVPGAFQTITGGATLTLTAGLVTYPITFLLTDTVAEIWGQRRAAFMVYAGFFMSFVMMAVLWIAVALPPAAAWTYPAYATTQESQLAYEATFSAPGVLVMASMTAYLVAQLIDVRLYHFWWRVTGGKHLWLRNNGSTWISQLVDTAVVNSILFYIGFGMDFWTGAGIMFTIYWHKLILAALDTPLIYAGVWLIHRLLGDERHRSHAAGA